MATISTQSPMPSPNARIAGTAAIATATIVLLAFPLVVTAAITPKFEQIFKDFGVALPVLARVFINVGRFLGSPFGWAGIAMVLVLVIVPASMLANRRWGFALSLLLFSLLWFLGYILVLIFSMFTPLMAMIQSIQAGKP